MEKEINRRSFLKTAFVAVISTAACPHEFLGKEEPRFKIAPDKTISGLYRVSFDKYPELKEVWGSVRIHINWPEEPGFPSIIVSRVPREEFDKDFACVSERCPHEGYPVGPLHPVLHDFECTGHFTLFTVEGIYKSGPASDHLESYICHYEQDANEMYVEIPGLVSVDDIREPYFYLHPPYPNPSAGEISFEYGLEERANIKFGVFDLNGNLLKTVKTASIAEGSYTETINISEFSPGTYILRLTVNGTKSAQRKFIIGK
jgi:hypothetical protein